MIGGYIGRCHHQRLPPSASSSQSSSSSSSDSELSESCDKECQSRPTKSLVLGGHGRLSPGNLELGIHSKYSPPSLQLCRVALVGDVVPVRASLQEKMRSWHSLFLERLTDRDNVANQSDTTEDKEDCVSTLQDLALLRTLRRWMSSWKGATLCVSTE
jgi:hypothetical protein